MGLDPEWEKLPDDELNDLLRRFFASVRNKEGKEYSKSGMTNLRSALNRHLSLPPHSRQINLMRDKTFQKANKVFKGQLRKNKKAGLHKVKHTKSMSAEEIDQCHDNYFLPNMHTNPLALQHKVFFDVAYHMARRGREGLRDLTRDSFVIKTDPQGKEYAEMTHDEPTKKNQGDEDHDNGKDDDNVMYADGTPRCPVKSLKLYLFKLNPLQEAFFQRPVAHAVSKITVPWYINAPVGKNKIGDFLKDICKLAGLSTIYTNHSIRATAINALLRGGHSALDVTNVSGHKTAEGLEPYLNRPTLKDRKTWSETLSRYATNDVDEGLVAPHAKAIMPGTSKASVLTPQQNLGENAGNQGMANATNPVEVAPHSSAIVPAPSKVSVPTFQQIPVGENANSQGKENAAQKGLIISGGTFQNCTIQLKL